MSVLRLERKKRVPTWEAEEMSLLDKGSSKTYFIDLGWADLNNLLKILNYDSFTLADGPP